MQELMKTTQMMTKEGEKEMYNFTFPCTLKFNVYDGGKCVLPKGTPNVEIAFKQSSKTWINKKTGKTENQNVYRWMGHIFNS